MVSAIDSFAEEEDFRIRASSGAHLTPATPLVTTSHIAHPFSGKSSIGAAKKLDAVTSTRPSLAPPKHDVRLDIIQVHSDLETFIDKYGKYFDGETKKKIDEVKELSAQRQAAVEEEAKAAASRKTWSTLATVAQYVASAGSIVLGAALLTTPGGQLPGGLLIASGVIGLTTQIAKDTGLLQAAVAWYTKSNELQKIITQRIEMGMLFLQLGLGLAGGATALYRGVVAVSQINSLAFQTKGGLALSTAATLMSAAGKLGSAYYDKKIAYLMAQIRAYDTKINVNNQVVSDEAKKIQEILDTGKTCTEKTKTATKVDID